MRIDLLHVPDCPNLDRTRARLHAALRHVAVPATVHEVEVATAEAAATVGMRGSPTILVDGDDPFAPAGGEPSLACRLFRTADGLDGAPSLDQLVEALSR